MASRKSTQPVDYEKLCATQQVRIKELDKLLYDKMAQLQAMHKAREERSDQMDKIYDLINTDAEALQHCAVRHVERTRT